MIRRVAFVLIGLSFILSCTKNEQLLEVAISQNTAELFVGESIQLHISVAPSDMYSYVSNLSAIWASSTPSVATINEYGRVTAVSEGTSTITATFGGKTVNCIVIVKNKFIPVSSISLDKSRLLIRRRGKEKLTVTINPSNATNQDLLWGSDDQTIATVDQMGVVTGIDGGTTIIAVRSGTASAYCIVEVSVPAETISINRSSLLLQSGASYQLSTEISPTNTTHKKVSWSSSNSSIVEVNDDGVVFAKQRGEALINASIDNISAICTVTVIENDVPEIDFIDLGLSVCWGSQNLGSDRLESSGEYYSWGEISSKNYYDWATYVHTKGDHRSLTRYCNNSLYGYNDFTDNLTQIEVTDDAVYRHFGEGYRIPSDSDWVELLQNCTWEATSINNMEGYKVISKIPGYTDKWIFLPYGYVMFGLRKEEADKPVCGYYWSSSLYTDLCYKAMSVGLFNDNVMRVDIERCYGIMIRPVSYR